MTSSAHLDWAIGRRHGLIAPPVAIAAMPADLDVHNFSVAYGDDEPWRAAGGGVGWDAETARNAAMAEALERYAAVSYELPIFEPDSSTPALTLDDFTLFSADQRARPDFPHAATFATDAPVTDVYRLTTNEMVYAPAALVGLTDQFGALPTSSGLAAAPSSEHALLRGIQELIERDAFMSVWLHGLAPPHLPLPASHTAPVRDRGGWVIALDITPAYSPHAVVMVLGNLPLFGRPRYSLGIACRAHWQEAADKAYLEWSQGVIFAGHRAHREPELHFATADDCQTFDDHASYYTVHPDRWQHLPVIRSQAPRSSRADAQPTDEPVDLASLVFALDAAGIDLYYRDLTLPDLAQIGLRVVRVLASSLTPIHSNHRWPHLGGTTAEIERRYPWVIETWARPCGDLFPSPHPHPLG